MYEFDKINDQFDIFFFIGWQSIIKKNFFGNYILKYPNIEKSKIVCGIHSHHSWDNKKTLPNHDVYPDPNLIKILNC